MLQFLVMQMIQKMMDHLVHHYFYCCCRMPMVASVVVVVVVVLNYYYYYNYYFLEIQNLQRMMDFHYSLEQQQQDETAVEAA